MRLFGATDYLFWFCTGSSRIKLSFQPNASFTTDSVRPLYILFNVFDEATIPLLMYKLEREYWSILKTFLIFLDRYPEINQGSLNEVDLDMDVYDTLTAIE